MKKQEFIDLLYANGWQATSDAQHELISNLFEEWHPKDAKIEQLEREIEYLDAKIASALIADERVVRCLLEEAQNRTHLDT